MNQEITTANERDRQTLLKQLQMAVEITKTPKREWNKEKDRLVML